MYNQYRFKQTTGQIPSQTDKVKSNKEPSVKNYLFNDIYDFNHSNKRVAILIINSSFSEYSKRPFASEDYTKMKTMFELMDFDVKVLVNKKSSDLRKELQTISRQMEESCDCLACVISSHGAEIPMESSNDTSAQPRHHVLFTADGIVPTDRILQEFNDDNCPNLQGKPRMFFIQACRSIFNPDNDPESEIDKGYTIDLLQELADNDIVPDKMNEKVTNAQIDAVDFCDIPCYEDYLVMFSSSSGKLGWSDKRGGWLMYCLFTVFEKLLDTDFDDFLQILSAVCGKMARDLETSHPKKVYNRTKSAAVIYHMLTKDLYLRPKSIKETET
ncbi:caspase-1-like [Mytilus californianus]|uniref:caspase-1-like n=1 Tax=Mytilus californianus TaxID=6549 RepID=UPI002246D33B|nr:caspase-1-like [Mytilus californianus]